MFSGIIAALGQVLETGPRLLVRPIAPMGDPWVVGESVAVNGCCLTLISSTDDRISFDLSEETLRRTTLGTVRPGAYVNLERALRLGDRLGGHFVQGHIDRMGDLLEREDHEKGCRMRFEVGDSELLIDKGSVAIDGISLTVVDPAEGEFDVWVIPHTLEATNLKNLAVGDRVNVEFDMIAKHVEKLLKSR